MFPDIAKHFINFFDLCETRQNINVYARLNPSRYCVAVEDAVDDTVETEYIEVEDDDILARDIEREERHQKQLMQ